MYKFFIFIASIFVLQVQAQPIQNMTVEEKVGQTLMVHFHGTEANEEAQTFIQNLHVGGFIYYSWANELSSPKQVQNLSTGLQNLAKQTRLGIPLLIAADQEGGLVEKVKGLTIFPGNKALGIANSPFFCFASAAWIGIELNAVGTNMNLAPVVDVTSNPRNPIGIRSYGNSPETVSECAEYALEGFHCAGIITSLKHFPGLGDVEIDSHSDLPIILKSKEDLYKMELLPFARLASKADTVMTAHILVPALDDQYGATFSKKILDLLKNELGFKRVIISDSLVMQGALKNFSSIDEAAIQAFNAGCDILLLGGLQLIGENIGQELTLEDVRWIHRSLVEAVSTGRISKERLDEAVQKILALKEQYQLSKQSYRKDLENIVNTKLSNCIADRIAYRALHTVKNEIDLSSIRNQKVVIFFPEELHNQLVEKELLTISSNSVLKTYAYEEDIDAAKESSENADALLICCANAWKNPAQRKLIDALLETGKPVILFVLRDPVDAKLFPQAELILLTHSPTLPSIKAACKKIKKKKVVSSQ